MLSYFGARDKAQKLQQEFSTFLDAVQQSLPLFEPIISPTQQNNALETPQNTNAGALVTFERVDWKLRWE
jgi:hypothetical protein